MVFGDTVAIAMMEARKPTREEYSANHHAGRIGKSLILKIQASVRVRRETTTPKPRPKASGAAATTVVHSFAPSFAKPAPRPSSTVKSQSVDDSYSAFLEDMKALGALDG
ncbi:hypothetical protein QQ045_005770 [Rhodiola kirilowii]